ncbi:MAG: ComEA family DNA-binding protein [Terriglobales bacterium]
MKGHVSVFLLGLGVAAAGAFAFDKYRSGELDTGELGQRAREMSDEIVSRAQELKSKAQQVASVAETTMVHLNEASREDLQRLGIGDPDILDRIIEHRPYRNKMDLLARMIVPEDVYENIKHRVDVERPNEGVKVA